MSKASFLHLADFHLDAPFESVSYLPPKLKEDLLNASLQAFEKAVQFAVSQEVDTVIVAGDIQHGFKCSTRSQLFFKEQLEVLSSAGIASILILGNHDLSTEWSMVTKWPKRVHFFGNKSFEHLRITNRSGAVLNFFGSSAVYEDLNSLRSSLERAIKESRPSKSEVSIGVLHADVLGGSSILNNYTCIPVKDLVSLPIDYWALGHIHEFSVLNTSPHVVYSGTIQGRSMKSTECGAKGGVFVCIDNGRIVETRFQAFSPVVFRQLELKIDKVLSQGDFILEIKNKLADVLRQGPQILRLHIETKLENRKSLSINSREEEFISTLRDLVYRELSCSIESVKWKNIQDVSSPLSDDLLEQVENIISIELNVLNERVSGILKSESPLKGINTEVNLDEILDGARDRIKSLLGCVNES